MLVSHCSTLPADGFIALESGEDLHIPVYQSRAGFYMAGFPSVIGFYGHRFQLADAAHGLPGGGYDSMPAHRDFKLAEHAREQVLLWAVEPLLPEMSLNWGLHRERFLPQQGEHLFQGFDLHLQPEDPGFTLVMRPSRT
jgi:hypothetical protein